MSRLLAPMPMLIWMVPNFTISSLQWCYCYFKYLYSDFNEQNCMQEGNLLHRLMKIIESPLLCITNTGSSFRNIIPNRTWSYSHFSRKRSRAYCTVDMISYNTRINILSTPTISVKHWRISVTSKLQTVIAHNNGEQTTFHTNETNKKVTSMRDATGWKSTVAIKYNPKLNPSDKTRQTLKKAIVSKGHSRKSKLALDSKAWLSSGII